MKIFLEEEEYLQGAIAGCYRRVRSRKEGKSDRHGHDGRDIWTMEIEGALAEMAVAKCMGRYWSGQEGERARDVLGFEIRQTAWSTGHLILHRDDEDDVPYMLVTGQLGRYEIRGWIWGSDGKLAKYWGELQKGRPAFNVPQDQLNPYNPTTAAAGASASASG